MHTPPMAAITGLALSSISLITVRRLGWATALGVPNSRISAPPEKPAPEPIKTMAATLGSALARSTPATNAWRSSSPRLLTGGLSSVRTAMPSLISKLSLFMLI